MRIFKNFRRPFPFFELPKLVIINKDKDYTMSKTLSFDKSTMYNFGDVDQLDINKLFGFSIGWHQDNSFRFGWRPNKDLTKMEILSYVYTNGVMSFEVITEVNLDNFYEYTLFCNSGNSVVKFLINNQNTYDFKSIEISIILKNKYNFGYGLGLYFGGNRKCPQTMDIIKN